MFNEGYVTGWLGAAAPGLTVRADRSVEEDFRTLLSFKVLLRLEMNESCSEGRAKSATLLGILPPR